MKSFILLFIAVIGMQSIDAQRVARYTSESGSVYPDVSLLNLVAMSDMNLGDWERNLKLISKLRDDFGDGGISYTVEAKTGTADGMVFITKNADAIELVHTVGTNGKSIFTDFLKEMPAYYVQESEGHQVYSYTSFTKVTYVILVKVTPEQEFVRIYVNK